MGFPEEDELVLCTITNIQPHSVFAQLDDFDKSGMIHISEISPGRIRNIRDFVSEGKKVVCKILRVNHEKGHIDLSLRRVTEVQKRQKQEQIKQEQKAEKIVESLAQQLKKPLNALYQEITEVLLKKYVYLFEAFSDVVENKTPLQQLGLKKEIAEPLTRLVLEKIKPKSVQIAGEACIQSYAENGVELVKNALVEAQKTSAQLAVKYEGGGKYHFLVVAPDYKHAEKILTSATDILSRHLGPQFSFKRVEN